MDTTRSEGPVEITPTMMEAGANVLTDFDWGWSNAKDFARRIYLAMEAERLLSSEESLPPAR
jgi:hypothetical protein